jgi:DNA-directed RNA polymerase omega subunit
MSVDKPQLSFESVGNKYLLVLAASKRSRQLLDRAEKHGMSADTEKVILQSLEEVLNGKVTYDVPPPPGSAAAKKKAKD